MGGTFSAGSIGRAEGSRHVVRPGSGPEVAAAGEVAFLWL